MRKSYQSCEEPYCSERKRSWLTCLFPITGLIALIWFLIRVIPKPRRATYPCQRVAFPLASAFIVWLVGILASVSAIRKAGKLINQSRYLVSVICIIAAVGFLWLCLSFTGDRKAFAVDPIPNEPMGTAMGIHPGRVVWIHDPNSTNWEGPGHDYPWEHTDQRHVDGMMSRAIRELAGSNSDPNAWDVLFRHFNMTHGRPNAGYTKGEKITIKVNLTTCNQRLWTVDPATYDKTDYLDKSDTSPQMIVALLKQLVYKAGVEPNDIAVGDTLTYFPNQWWDICHSRFPKVSYFDCAGAFGRRQVQPSKVVQHWSHGLDPNLYETDYLPVLFAEADYLINLAVLKSHNAGITLCAKNHYGSYIRTPDADGYYNLHDSLAGDSYDPTPLHYRALVDIMGHPEMGKKTLLYMLDALYAGCYWEATPYRFQMAPFNNNWPSSLFASQDPVAIDSVGLDFLWTEWPHVVQVGAVDDYLHEAAQAGNPPSATFYDPNGDGTGLDSLGVHEHWNNAIDKQYSRNLGDPNGIELISVKLTHISADLDFNGIIDAADLLLFAAQWLKTEPYLSADIAPQPPDGMVNYLDFAAFAENWRR